MVYGSTVPRLWTPPLRELTPETSVGWHQSDFARDVLRAPFDPWQDWLVKHAGELLPDGRPRFRKVIVLVSRQNGKTHVPVVLSIYWLFVQKWPLVLGTSTKLDYAQESWQKALNLIRPIPILWAEVPKKGGIRRANGEQHLITQHDTRYKIAASNEEGGRSLSIDRLVLDELRQHHSYDAVAASVPAMNARMYGQAWALSNAGDDRSVVLNDWRAEALKFIETGEGDPRVGLFEWSSPDGSDPLDVPALLAANPNVGHRIDLDVLLGDAQTAVNTGGKALATFKTENMCMRVLSYDPAVDLAAWQACFVDGDLEGLRSRLGMCVDVSPDRQHATAVAAGLMPDGRVRLEVVETWTGPTAVTDMIRALPALVRKVRPQVFGWFPGGPAAAAATQLADRKGRRVWPPPGITVEEIRGEVTAVCMAFASAVDGRTVVHSDDPAGPPALMTAHIGGAQKLFQGDVWRFQRITRKQGAEEVGHCDAAYATAGATHLALTLPTPIGKPKLYSAG